ncbi:hypothetical protein LSH36_450g02092 [Paralvinella palmiformis]|uniref:Uncharacterized protein n=1 Tax=Paralvinella palmiformis TaxID=53620 RepID=A0AAD9JB13_9ANNE|nr:hypothetical protein LSH36_450g02092 [Paralvinella palmiformis]
MNRTRLAQSATLQQTPRQRNWTPAILEIRREHNPLLGVRNISFDERGSLWIVSNNGIESDMADGSVESYLESGGLSRFSFSHETIAEMALFSISRPVKLSGDLIHNDMRYKLRRRIIALIKSGDIQGEGDLSFTDFNLTDRKPGLCPPAHMITNDTCQSQCTADSQCPGEKICCKNGCGVMDCMSPRGSLYNRLELLACEGNVIELVCPSGYQIKAQLIVYLAFVVYLMKTMCENKEDCRVSAMTSFLGEPCSNKWTNKYLKAEYYCEEKFSNVDFCENSGLKSISYNGGQVIATHSAFWGRDDDTSICPDPSINGTTDCSQNNADQIFRLMCDGRTSCQFDPVSTVFGNICPGVHKYLSLTYKCKNCINEYPDDNKCEFWGLKGECGRNLIWMTNNCRRTCTRRSDWKPDMVNYHHNSTECDVWARSGECIKNPPYMLVYCRKSCLAPVSLIECLNKATDYACEYWMRFGGCMSSSSYMLKYCSGACSRCDPKINGVPVAAPKVKVGADMSENVGWMRKTNDFTRGMSIVGPWKIPVSGRLTGFDLRVVSDNELSLEIWRQNYSSEDTTSKNFDRVYYLNVKYAGSPDKPVSKTVSLPDCFEVKKGDWIGFSSRRGNAPLDYCSDKTFNELTYFRSALSETGGFLAKSFTYQFAIGAQVEEGGTCPDVLGDAFE